MTAITLALGVLLSVNTQYHPTSAPGATALEPTVSDTLHYRIYRADGTPATMNDIEAAIRESDVFFVGESHDDPIVHHLQFVFLQQAYRQFGQKPNNVALSMEMFARDVQLIVDEYLSDQVTEDQFLAATEPWDNYESDYRPLVEFAKNHELDVVAANAPRRYANRVTRLGRESILDLSDQARSYLAPWPYAKASERYAEQFSQAMVEAMEEMAEMAEEEAEQDDGECECKCPMMAEKDMRHGEKMKEMKHGEKYKAMMADSTAGAHTVDHSVTMADSTAGAHAMDHAAMMADRTAGAHTMDHSAMMADSTGRDAEMPHAAPDAADDEQPLHGGGPGMPSTGNMLDSQSLWDATMAYAISEYRKAHPTVPVMHIVGGFHVRTGTGIPEHLARYAPGLKTLIIAVEPVEDIGAFDPEEHENLGDFVILSDESLPRTFERKLN